MQQHDLKVPIGTWIPNVVILNQDFRLLLLSLTKYLVISLLIFTFPIHIPHTTVNISISINITILFFIINLAILFTPNLLLGNHTYELIFDLFNNNSNRTIYLHLHSFHKNNC